MFGTYQLPMLKGSQVFPNTMRAPATVQIIIMDRLDLWHDHAQDMVDAGHRIVRSHLGQITSFFQGQRQNYSLSIIQSSKTRLALPKLEVEYYCMPNGQEHLTIVVDPASDVLAKKTEEDLCLLVLYNGGSVAAIPMATLPKAAPIYTSKLKHSSWALDKMRVTQLKLEKGFSVVYSPINVAKNVISAKTTYQLTTAGVPKALDTFASGSTDITMTPPILNGQNKVYYGGSDTFTFGPTGLTAAPNGSTYNPYVITTTGDKFYDPKIHGFGGTPSLALFVGDVGSARPPYDPQIVDYLNSLTSTSGSTVTSPYDTVFYTKNDTTLLLGYVLGTSDLANANRGAAGNISGDIPWPIWSQSAGLDQISTTTPLSTSMSLHENFSGDPSWVDDYSVTIFGAKQEIVTKSSDGGVTWDNGWFSGYTAVFPFSTKDRGSYILDITAGAAAPGVYQTVAYSDPTATMVTPYGRRNGAFFGWLHLSNGKHLIQAFTVNDVQEIYYDGVEVKLDPHWNVQAMVMDVPLSRIKDFV